jgi:nitrate/nitrite transport system permease protein
LKALRAHAAHIAGVVLPPVAMLALLGVVWQVICSSPDATLPPPSKVLADTHELIVKPFYDNGGNDKGLFWHLLASLKRVALGYSLAATVGIGLGVLIGSSKWALRALDPLFQVLRTIPPLAWLPLSLAAFRDGQPSAIFTGLRIGIGLSWLAIVAAEMLIGGVGIGFFIWDAWNSSLISDIILALVYVGIVGFLLDRVIALSGKLIGRGTVSV